MSKSGKKNSIDTEDERVPLLLYCQFNNNNGRYHSRSNNIESCSQNNCIGIATEPVLPLVRSEQEETDEVHHGPGSHATDEEARPVNHTDQLETSSRALATIFLSLYIGVFLAAADGTIVATLLSRIASDFDEFRSVSWIATGYLIAQTAFQPLYGKFSDIYGRKPILIICNVVFGFGSVLCGLAPTLWILVLARVITGAGGGGLMSLAAITLSDIVSLRQRGLLHGIGNILYGCGAAFGGIAGGLLTETVGWRWTFAMQGPIIVLSIIAIQCNLKIPQLHKSINHNRTTSSTTSGKLRRIDFLGSVTLVCGLALFLYAVSAGGNYFPWAHAAVVVPLVLAFIVLCGFAWVELRVAPEPVIPLQLLQDRTVAGSAFTCWFMIMVYFANIFYTAIFMTAVKQQSATKSGMSLLPQFVGSAAGAVSCGYYMRRTGRYKPMSYVAGASLVLGSLLLSTIGINSPDWLVSCYLLLPGFGGGMYLTITLVGLIAAVPFQHQAVCTSIQYGFRGTGSTIGVAVCAAIFHNILSNRLHDRITGPGADDIIKRVQDSVDEVRAVPEQYQTVVTQCYLDATHAVLYTSVFMASCAFFASLCMQERPLHSSVRRK
ncbi:major facilitator superfamily domain-containing protein [Lipomyces japonicus]|uniref:major facilitator superfamily domain-containing protein n=1 Tax=Lipomyces japonicus TaxID=56871 RepID=UPI0034CD76B6